MSTTPKHGGPAFPEVRIRGGDNYNAPTKIYYQGMSLRDWFAGMAMSNGYTEISSAQEIAAWSYQIADAMLEARKGGSHE